MVPTPTRRHPPTYPDRRRPPRGRTPVAGSIRDRLANAATQLRKVGKDEESKAGHLRESGNEASADAALQRAEEAFDSAAAVDAVLAPRGYVLLKNTEVLGATGKLTLSLAKTLKDALTVAGAEFGVVFSGLVEEAYQKVRDGEWVPPQSVRAPKGTAGGAAVLNVAINEELRRQVRAMLPELSAQAGYRVTEGGIAVSYICDQLGIERPNMLDSEGLAVRVPRSLVRHWEEQAEALGVSLEQIVEDRIPAVVDGSWKPGPHPYMADAKSRARVPDVNRPGYTIWSPVERSWSESDRAKLWLRIDKDLLAGLRSKAEELSEESGSLVYPGAIVRAILTDRLGEPAE